MTQPAIIFVHGGQHTKQCWAPTINAITGLQADTKMLAVNLPGRGGDGGELDGLTIAKCVARVVEKIREQAFDEVVLVGHSMAGVTLPGVVEKLGAKVVKKVIFLACCIPPDGKAVFDTLQQPIRFITQQAAKKRAVSSPLPIFVATWLFANGMTKQQKKLMANELCAESTAIPNEPVDRSGFPKVPMCWIITLRDRAVRPSLQRQFIDNLGGVDDIIEIDTCHDAMISEPHKLAKMLLEQCPS